MNNTLVISKRELGAYFATPVAYVFIVIFLLSLIHISEPTRPY